VVAEILKGGPVTWQGMTRASCTSGCRNAHRVRAVPAWIGVAASPSRSSRRSGRVPEDARDHRGCRQDSHRSRSS